MSPFDQRVALAQTALRVVAGAAFFTHGGQKLLGLFGGVGPDGGTVALMSSAGAAGVIELVAGVLLVIGLFTRITAFIASGEMAAAYFIGHVSSNGQLFWWENRGELAMLYCFIFLLFAAWGAGPYSVDATRSRGRIDEVPVHNLH